MGIVEEDLLAHFSNVMTGIEDVKVVVFECRFPLHAKSCTVPKDGMRSAMAAGAECDVAFSAGRGRQQKATRRIAVHFSVPGL